MTFFSHFQSRNVRYRHLGPSSSSPWLRSVADEPPKESALHGLSGIESSPSPDHRLPDSTSSVSPANERFGEEEDDRSPFSYPLLLPLPGRSRLMMVPPARRLTTIRGSRKAPTPMVDESRMKSGNYSLLGLCYTRWPGFQAVDGGRERPIFGATLSGGTNRNQAQILISTAALQTAEREGPPGLYVWRGVGTRPPLNPGAGMAALPQDGCYFLADVVGAQKNQREENHTHPCPNPAGIIAYAPRGEPACRIAKRRIRGGRGITDQLAGGPSEPWRITSQARSGRRCTVNPC